MNRKNLTSAVLAGLAGVAGIAASAQAVNINPDGLGQVLIYPYYTTRGGNTTLVSVVNTTDNAKAVKVRFLEGQNTREVLDFNLYLSEYDVWTAALLDGSAVDTECNITNGLVDNQGNPLEGADGGQCGVPHLLTTDTSCTVPYLFESASTGPGLQSFLPYALIDNGSQAIDRAAEGHFEMIEMGTLVGSFAAAATHASGVPANCQALVDAWTTSDNPLLSGVWAGGAPLTDIEAPSGGLFGGAAVVDVTNGYMVSYDATAINGFATVADPNGIALHAAPGTIEPNLNSGDVLDATVFGDDGATIASAGLTRGVDAVSFVFMHDQLMNQYSIGGVAAAATEWVITFPTKHFYVYEETSGSATALAPFTAAWDGDGACEAVELEGIYDREETTIVPPPPGETDPIVSPAPPPPPVPPIQLFELCYETNVIRFGDLDSAGETTEILGSKNFTNFDVPFSDGWVQIELDDYADQGGAQSRDALGGLEGLPVTGFAVQKFGNANADAGLAAFYGGLYEHKGTRKAGS